jgi:hypothetical protein
VNAKRNPSALITRPGFFATLTRLLRAKGSSAPSAATSARLPFAYPSLAAATDSSLRERASRARTQRWALFCVLTSLAFACLFAPSAHAAFGFNNFDVTYTNADGTLAAAGSHPFAMTTSFGTNFDAQEIPEGYIRDALFEQVPGFVADTSGYPRCATAEFLQLIDNEPGCAPETQIGIIAVSTSGSNEIGAGGWETHPLYNITPPPGELLRLGFHVVTQSIFVDGALNQSPPYNALAISRNTPQLLNVYGVRAQLWGNPSDPGHDGLRGHCGHQEAFLAPGDIAGFHFEGTGDLCPVVRSTRAFLTTPTTCAEPLASSYQALSWNDRDGDGLPDTDAGSSLNHGLAGPEPFAFCGKLNFSPSIAAQPTTKAATSPTGLDFSLDVADEGLLSAGGLAQSDIEKAEVTLPEGMSANPSLAEGLAVCSEADLQAETLDAAPGEGCPQAAKIGSLEVTSPLVEESIQGALYQATPYENQADDALLAFYIVFRNRHLGILVKQPAKVLSDPVTGRLTTITDQIPQLPFSHFRLHFREGARSPLVSPPSCGAHQVKAVLYPWSGGPPVESTSTFQIVSGPDNAPCPAGGLPPFHPHLEAGTLNNAAGRFSPFNLRISRSDSEQEINHFSIKLPPGVIGRLAGISTCSDAAIAAATARTGPHGGAEELQSPSCPASSYVGRTLVGSGVGPALAYAPGRVYLAGPYHGAPISFVAITAALVGPFDIGTVVVRLALRLNPETGEVFLDATGTDPIPHIVKGIPVHLREIRAYTDRPEFVLNPTSCAPTSTASTVLGAGLDFASAADDNPLVITSPFQAADCAALPFHPKLTFRLKGSTKRGGNPSLAAHVAMNGIGEAAIAYAQVALPRSEFLDNSHIGTVCTRVQFREGAVPGEKCPPDSVYGHVKALTPILEGPLEGPIYLRSSEHELPDLVATLHHQEIDVVLVGRVDSVKSGGIRNTFEFVPDAPVTSADFVFDGAAKGLLENSTNLCQGKHLVGVKLKAHSGKFSNYNAPLKATGCKKHAKNKPHAQHGRSPAR